MHDAAVAVARVLLDAGYESYFAGGCVRDRLLGGVPDDYDIATAARPDDVRRLFPKAQGVGESFGVMLVRHGGHEFEIATFRNDGEYADGRRPNDVRFSDAREDAFRRDFTINGLFEEPSTGRVVDFVDGQSDLTNRVIRAIGNPNDRFAEDHLRLLRGVRFAARFGFALETATAAAMREHAGKLAVIARERIGGEVRRMLEHPTRVAAVQLLEEQGLDAPTLREPARVSPSLARLVRLEGAVAGDLSDVGLLDRTVPVAAALAAWALDRHGPNVGESVIHGWREALLLSNRESVETLATLAALARVRHWSELRESARKRWAASPMASWAQTLFAVESPCGADNLVRWRRQTDPATIAPPPLLTGDHLIRAGFAPGPQFRELLDAAYDAQLEGRVGNAADALELVRSSAGGPSESTANPRPDPSQG
ncbi:MAG: CCA tRNA nucleotidyltransferase [Phycisphaerae bacterium]|nr:CCA tRNA nucleotidyltransferase [Phycisphaerae bacterium]